MPRITATGLLLPLFLLFAPPEATSNNSAARKQTIPGSHGQTGTLQKMIVETGTVTMDLDLDRLMADGSLVALALWQKSSYYTPYAIKRTQ